MKSKNYTHTNNGELATNIAKNAQTIAIIIAKNTQRDEILKLNALVNERVKTDLRLRGLTERAKRGSKKVRRGRGRVILRVRERNNVK